MSAVLNSKENLKAESRRDAGLDIREGDWKAYCQHLSAPRANASSAAEDNIAYKRACALAYLGRRAQLHGGACNAGRPHIMTPRFIAELEADNRMRRFSRYPWLEAWSNVLAEIERLQDEISATSNVISLVQPNSR